MFDHHLKRNSKMGKRKPKDLKDQQNKIMSKTGKQNMKKDQNKEDQQNNIQDQNITNTKITTKTKISKPKQDQHKKQHKKTTEKISNRPPCNSTGFSRLAPRAIRRLHLQNTF